MKTLYLRVSWQSKSALKIARFLQGRKEVENVFYPGLESHPQYDIACRQMKAFGGVLSFTIKGGFDSVRTFLPRLTYAHRAANLGSVETIAGPPSVTSHVECTPVSA